MPIYNEDDAASYDMPTGEADFDWSTAPDQLPTETARDAAYEQYLAAAGASGVDSPLVQTLKNAWSAGTSFVKDNPSLTKGLLSGIGNAQNQKYTNEQIAMRNQFNIDAENRATAKEKELNERRNQSVIDTKPAKLGIIGSNMLDSQLAYLKGRK